MLAVYPGSFDPPTVAHLAIARSALAHVDEVRFVLSEIALGKEGLPPDRATVALRRAVLADAVRGVAGLTVGVTGARLVVDIAEEAGADAVVVGADKWAQILDPAWYGGSATARDAAVARLPRVLLAPRTGGGDPGAGPHPVPSPGPAITLLTVDSAHHDVSSTRARAGEVHLMAPEARTSGHWG